MVSSSNRRIQRRFEIPEATAYTKTDKWYNLIDAFNGPERLIDFSSGGIGLETLQQVKKDDLLQVKIDIPGEDALVLKGLVRWTSPVEWNRKTRVGVEFTPYGRRRQNNSPFTLATLQVLQEKFERSGK